MLIKHFLIFEFQLPENAKIAISNTIFQVYKYIRTWAYIDKFAQTNE